MEFSGHYAFLEVLTHVGWFKTIFWLIIAFVTSADPLSIFVKIKELGKVLFKTLNKCTKTCI